jgi:hypothetical protein
MPRFKMKSESSGLTSTQQLIDVTSNEIFSISQNTSDTEKLYFVPEPMGVELKPLENDIIAEDLEKTEEEPLFGENIGELKRVLKSIFVK